MISRRAPRSTRPTLWHRDRTLYPEGFRKTQLFYTVNSPCGALLGLVLDYIFRALDVVVTTKPDQELDELRTVQVPVHPFVAERLAIEWAGETRLYRNGDRDLTWEEFVRGYMRHYG